MAGYQTPVTALLAKCAIVTGGISPLGQRRQLPTVVHSSAAHVPAMYVSAGRRGLQLRLAPADLIALTGAITARIASR